MEAVCKLYIYTSWSSSFLEGHTRPQLRQTNYLYMLSSPSTSFSTIAWPLKNPMSPEHSNYVYRETEASKSFAQDYPPSQPKLEPNCSTISTSIGSSPTMVKKLYHNASERDRRKKINTLYSSLRTLLPPADQAVLLVNICFHLNFFWETRMFKALWTLQFLLLSWEFPMGN